MNQYGKIKARRFKNEIMLISKFEKNKRLKVHMKRNFLFPVLIEPSVLISMVQSVFSSAV